jgi:hypothetical protein
VAKTKELKKRSLGMKKAMNHHRTSVLERAVSRERLFF